MTTPVAPPAVPDEQPKWLVMLDPYDPSVSASLCWNSIVAEAQRHPDEPGVLLRGDLLVRVSTDDGRTTFSLFDRFSLRDYLSRICQFKQPSGATIKKVKLPFDVVQTLLARIPSELPAAAKCNRIADVPIFGPDGSLAGTRGYHETARVYLAPAKGLDSLILSAADWATLEEKALHRESPEHDVSEKLTQQRADVQAARDYLLSMIEEFPFRDQASIAHSVCLILEPFVRELVGDEPTPLYGITAHQPRTGKTLLAQVCSHIGCGTIPATSYMHDDDELRKTITAMILEGAPVVWFDNVKGRMDSGALAGALTSGRWTGRILGHTKTIGNMPVRNVWLMTGNNPTMHPELARRVVPIRLDVPKPQGYEYDRPHLMEYVKKERRKLVNACVVLVANYLNHRAEFDLAGDVVASSPDSQDTLDSFPAWSRIMGGILAGANIEGFLDNRDEWMTESVLDTADSGFFFSQWHERLAETPVTLDELLHVIGGRKTDGELILGMKPMDSPEETQDSRGEVTKSKLGAFLRGANGSEVIPGFRLSRRDTRPATWKLSPL